MEGGGGGKRDKNTPRVFQTYSNSKRGRLAGNTTGTEQGETFGPPAKKQRPQIKEEETGEPDVSGALEKRTREQKS